MLGKLFQSEFIKNSSILIVGTVLAQLIPIALQPVIRRIYTDAETGRFDIYLSIVAILASVAHLNYARTVVIPKEKKSAINLLGGSLLSGFLFSLILYLVFLFSGENILKMFSLPLSVLPWLPYVPLSVFFISSYTSIGFWLTRQKKFKSIAYNKFVRRSTEGVAQVALKKVSSNGLILGNITGDFFNFLIHLIQLKRSEFDKKQISLGAIKQEFIRYKDFPLYSLLPTLLNTLSSNLPIIIVGVLFSENIVGQFGLSRMVLVIPLALVSVAISQVLLQKVTEYRHNRQSIYPLIKNIALSLIAIAILGSVVIYLFGEPIFIFAFGDKWQMAGELARTLTLSFSISFVVTPLSVVLIALERVKTAGGWQVLHFAFILTLYIIDVDSIYEFVNAFVLINAISYLVYAYLIYRAVLKYEKEIEIIRR